ncbi:MAG: tetratricopeptide repeat protein [Myxococcales bacterium]|nr:tetratricopeptide repeat protein [Myxococcales bacterium]
MTESPNKRRAMLEKLIARGTDDPFVRYARALELRSEGQLEQALEALGEVRQLHPRYVPTFLMAGQIAIELESIDAARQWLEDGIVVASEEGDAHAESELKQALGQL